MEDDIEEDVESELLPTEEEEEEDEEDEEDEKDDDEEEYEDVDGAVVDMTEFVE